jgi:hypothetical protein
MGPNHDRLPRKKCEAESRRAGSFLDDARTHFFQPKTAKNIQRAFLAASLAAKKGGSVALGQFRLNRATIALFPQDGRIAAQTIPMGTVLTVDPIHFDKEFTDVMWGDRKATMFTVDLRLRSESVKGE